MRKNGQAKSDMPDLLLSLVEPTPHDPFGEQLYPTLSSLLLPRYREGVMVREGAAVTFRAVGTTFLVSIICPTEKRSISLQVDGVSDLLAQIEDRLVKKQYAYDLDWRTKRRARQKLDKPLT